MPSTFAALAAALTLAASVAASPALAQQPRALPATAAQVAAPTFGTAIMSAWVHTDGTIITGAGVVKAIVHNAPKYYEVQFNRPLAGCVSTVSGLATTTPAVATSWVYQDSDKVQVIILLEAVLIHYPFQLIVFCPK